MYYKYYISETKIFQYINKRTKTFHNKIKAIVVDIRDLHNATYMFKLYILTLTEEETKYQLRT